MSAGAEPVRGAEPPTVDLTALRAAALAAQPDPAPPAADLPEPAASLQGPAPESQPAPCPSCGAPVWPQDNFCESCRAELTPAVLSAEAGRTVPRCPTC